MLILEPLVRFTSVNITGKKKNPVFAKKLPYDIDNKCTYVLPINKSNLFKSVKEGRP